MTADNENESSGSRARLNPENRRERTSDIVALSALLVAGAGMFAYSLWWAPWAAPGSPGGGPHILPAIAAGLIALGAATTVVTVIFGQAPRPESLHVLIALLPPLATAVYIYLVLRIGFVTATFAALAAGLWATGIKGWRARILLPVAITAVVYWFFVGGMDIFLPSPLLF